MVFCLFCFLFYRSVSVKLNYLNLFSGTHCSLCVYDSFHIWFCCLSWPLWHLGHIWGAYWNTSITDPIVRLFLRRETSEIFHHSEVTSKTTEPRPQIFSVNGSIIWQFYCTIDVIFHISQNSSKFGGQKLVMTNFACDFSQSDIYTEKYFGWILTNYWMRFL